MVKNTFFVLFFSLLVMILFNQRAYSFDHTLSFQITHYGINNNSLFGDFKIEPLQKKIDYQFNIFEKLNNSVIFNSNLGLLVQKDKECKFDYYLNKAYFTCYFNDATIIELGKNNLNFGNSLTEDILHYHQNIGYTRSKSAYWMVNTKKYFDNLGMMLLYIPSYQGVLSSEWVNAIDESQTYLMLSYNLFKSDIRALYKVNKEDPFIAVSLSRAFEKLANTIFYLDTKIIAYDTKYCLGKTNYSGIDYYIKEIANVKDYFNPLLLGINWQMFSIADCRLEYVRSDYSLSREEQKVFWENLASKQLIYRDFDKKNLISTNYLNFNTAFLQVFSKTDMIFNLKYNLDDHSATTRLVLTINLDSYSIDLNTAKTFAPSNKSEFGSYPVKSEFSVSLNRFF